MHYRRTSLLARAASSAAAAVVVALTLSACAAPGEAAAPGDVDDAPATESTAAATDRPGVLRLGYFPNVTHAPALVGIAGGYFEAALGDVALEVHAFTNGPQALEALHAGAVDLTFTGANPAINAFVSANGESLRFVAGTASGGAQLVVREGITGPADLYGTTLATPQLGGTQDVALRIWLEDHGFATDLGGGGDVSVTPTDNPQTFQLFQSGHLDGGWLPEPWASRLVLDAGAHVLVDERDLWEGGEFNTTILVASTDFLSAHPDVVEDLLSGLVAAIDSIETDEARARELSNDQIAHSAGGRLDDHVMERAFGNLTFTVDPLASALSTLQENGVRAGTTRPVSLDGIYDLRPLNAVLRAAGREPVSAAGLGAE